MLSKEDIRRKIFDLIIGERERQDIKHNFDPEQWLDLLAPVLGEEFGEVCTAIQNNDVENLREELVQVAAVAVRALEYLITKDMKFVYSKNQRKLF